MWENNCQSISKKARWDLKKKKNGTKRGTK